MLLNSNANNNHLYIYKLYLFVLVIINHIFLLRFRFVVEVIIKKKGGLTQSVFVFISKIKIQ